MPAGLVILLEGEELLYAFSLRRLAVSSDSRGRLSYLTLRVMIMFGGEAPHPAPTAPHELHFSTKRKFFFDALPNIPPTRYVTH